MRPLLSLVAIVKDEATNIRKTLESVRPYVDWWTIVDTGSTDGTPAIIREVMAGVPGQLIEEPFVDFSTTRNRALDLDAESGWDPQIGKSCEFTLTLSGDETLHGGKELRAFLEGDGRKIHTNAGAFCVQMISGERTWPYTRVLRTDSGWRYVGKVHERPAGPSGETQALLIPGVRVMHAATDPERKRRRILEYDLPTLTSIVEDESKSLEDRAHAIFFLAETHALLAATAPKSANGELQPGGVWWTHQYTAMSMYWRYAEIADQPDKPAYDANKVHYSLLMFYSLAERAQLYESHELVSRLQALVSVAPKLPEARLLLAKHAAAIDAKQGCFLALEAARVAKEAKANPTNEATNLDLEWKAWLIAAACAKALGNTKQARKGAESAVAAGAPRQTVEEFLK